MYLNTFIKSLIFLTIIGFFLLSATAIYAQPGKRLRNNPLYAGYNTIGEISFHAAIGTSHYFGDVSYNHFQYNQVLFTKPYLQFGLNTRFHERISMRLQFATFQLWGGDAPGTPNARRGINFVSENMEGSIHGIFDFIPQNKQTRIKFSPYLMAGVGLMYFRPRTQDRLGNWYDLRTLQLEGTTFRPVTLTIPFGGGIRYKVAKGLYFGAEFSYRFTASDYLDGVSTNYDFVPSPELTEFLKNSNEGIRAVNGRQRGSSSSRDGFFSAVAFIEYQPSKKSPSAKYRSKRRYSTPKR